MSFLYLNTYIHVKKVIAAEEQECWLVLDLGCYLSTVVTLKSLKRSVWGEETVSCEM